MTEPGEGLVAGGGEVTPIWRPEDVDLYGTCPYAEFVGLPPELQTAVLEEVGRRRRIVESFTEIFQVNQGQAITRDFVEQVIGFRDSLPGD